MTHYVFTMELIMKAIPLADHLTESELAEKMRHEKDASVRDRYRAILWVHQGESQTIVCISLDP